MHRIKKIKVKGFTLIELMVVILIVGILAAVSVPMMRGKVDDAKWAEAHAKAGMIRRAERIYFLETGKAIKGKLNNKKRTEPLGLESGDLNGTYFAASNFRIIKVDAEGNATIRVTANKKLSGLRGRKTLYPNGDWK